MKTLVVGGTGFIGSHIVDALLLAGHQVRVFDRQPEKFRTPVPSVDYRFGSFLDRSSLVEAMVGSDAVLHLVSTTFPGTASLDPQTDVQENLIGTLGLLDSMVSLGIRRILYLSSGGTVYGTPEITPIPETHPLRPINSYGIVKVGIESYLEMYRQTRGLSPVIIRASNPYGPRQAHLGVQGVISTFLRRVQAGERIEVWGDGTITRDYIYVSDLAELCAKAVSTDAEGAFNAGSGQGTTINEIINSISKVTKTSVQPIYLQGRAVDVPLSVLNVEKAALEFGWRSQLDLHNGLENTWQWLSEQSKTPSV